MRNASTTRGAARLGAVALAAAALVGSTVRPAAALDMPAAAGAQALPDMGYLSHVNPSCTHHVSTAGSDSNSGLSEASAWRTVGKALLALRDGQTACVHAGTYREDANDAADGGTATAPITVRGAPGEPRPVIRATADDPVFRFGPGDDFWVVDGFDVDKRHPDTGAPTDDHGVRISGARHVTVRNSVIHDGRGPVGVAVSSGSTDVNVDNVEVYNFDRGDQDAHGVAPLGNVRRVLVQRSRLHHNSGDGVQCTGVNDGGPTHPIPASSEDSSDITLLDNRIYSNAENAVDIKSCQRVSIRGSVSPDTPGSAANNKFFNYRPKSTSPQGTAIVLHINARSVLVENTRIWDACTGISIGRTDYPATRDVVIRRTLFFNLAGPTNGSGCTGRGVQVTNVANLDVYHNTFDNVPERAIRLGAGDNFDVWNNIVSNAGTWIDLSSNVSNFESNHNLFWHADGSSGHLKLNGSTTTLSAWRSSTGQDTASIHSDPLFVADPTSNDYYTQSTSRARDAALDNTRSRFCGAGPDIGFRESGC